MPKKKNLTPSYQKAVRIPAANIPLATSGRLDFKKHPETLKFREFFEKFVLLWNSALHWTFKRYLKRGFRTEGKLKKEIMSRYGLKARAANALMKDAKQMIESAVEIKKIQIDEHYSKIKAIESEISKIQSEQEQLCKKNGNWSRPEKKDLKTYQNNKARLWKLKDRLNRYRQTVSRLEREVETRSFSYCFGSRKLARQQWNIDHPNNPFRSHEEWKRKWKENRNRRIYFLGSTDESRGNQLVQGTRRNKTDLFDFTVRSPYSNDKDTICFSVSIPWQTSLLDAAQGSGSVSYTFIRKENGSIYVQPQLEEKAKPAEETEGCMGLDINNGFISCSYADEDGNFVETEDFVYSKVSRNADTAMQQIAAEIMKKARENQMSAAIEDICLTDKKQSNLGKKMNRTLHGFPYQKYRQIMERAAARYGVRLYVVSAAYTSRLGKKKHQSALGVSVHQAAAYVIARRALGFTEIWKEEKKPEQKQKKKLQKAEPSAV